jgi:hypothetical protein
MIELGTKQHPYKSFKAVASELLNNFSFLNASITIYLKEGERIYVEDNTNYFFDLDSVTVTSYSSSSSSPGRALMVPTEIVQPAIHSKSLFHLLAHANLFLNETLAKGE